MCCGTFREHAFSDERLRLCRTGTVVRTVELVRRGDLLQNKFTSSPWTSDKNPTYSVVAVVSFFGSFNNVDDMAHAEDLCISLLSSLLSRTSLDPAKSRHTRRPFTLHTQDLHGFVSKPHRHRPRGPAAIATREPQNVAGHACGMLRSAWAICCQGIFGPS